LDRREFVEGEEKRAAGAGEAVVWAGLALVLACLLPGFLIAGMAPRVESDLHFGSSALGLALALFYVSSSAMAMISGSLVRRLGIRRASGAACASTSISCLGIAALANSEASLIALLMIGGIGNALAGPTVSALLTANTPSTRHGLFFGMQQASAPLGSLLAGLALPAVAIPFGWRWAFVAVAVLAFLAAAGIPASAAGAVTKSARLAGERVRPILALAVAAVFASAAAVGFVGFLVTYAVHRGIGESWAGWLLAGVSLAAAASRVGIGALADRSLSSPLRPLVGMLSAAAVGYALVIPGERVALVAGAVLAGSLGWSWPGSLTHAVVRLAPEAPASAVGMMMSGLFAGAVIGPLLVGLLAGGEHFTVAWALCAAMALLAAGCVAVAQRLAAGELQPRRAPSPGARR
jgi:MFS family permease